MKRIAVIDKEKCRPEKCNYECIKVCPPQKNNIEVFKIGEDKKPIIDESVCIGCGLCAKKCPYKAIIIINLVKEPDKSPVFQYGPNAFRLYRLPVIKRGQVVGIIGRNGMGKTTAIKILSGLLKPNLGKKEVSEKEILEFFRGSELQTYFEKLFKNQIKVSYKPQEIYVFIKLYGEKKVRELIEKVKYDEELLKKFGLIDLLDRKVKDLSGGELQRLIIYLCSNKEADVYLYDEPTAYLDIYERLRLAIYLKEKVNENISILVIDHDLLFLDYVADIIHIVYGVPKAYGVFSYPMGCREGINEYLEGYIRRENLRMRDKAIRFDLKPFAEIKSDEKLIEWKDLKVRLNGFELEAKEGFIYKKEIVGVVGRNGIGKTTFARALAGLIKYEGEISGNVSIAYKPQYLEAPEGITVNQYLMSLNPNFKTEYKEYVVELGIADLLDHEMNTLSGGELQTVITFGTLIQDKDLYIIDEPFVFLDVEQRIRMAKFIREIVKQKEKSALVIEHDLLFVDYISDRMIVFDGIPGKYGKVLGPFENKVALNLFLKQVDITIRREPESKRPRINKPGSYLDRIQKAKGEYYA